MPILLNPQMMRQVIMDHYENPQFKKTPEKPEIFEKIHMHSSNCIDDINVYGLVENGVVKEAYWDGVACTISTSSTDIMCGLMIGKTWEEAKYIIDQYHHMIHEEPYDDWVLDEAIVFMNTSKQAARIKCATIGWDAMDEIICKHHHEK